mgnify:CR=1 FL=1
MEKQFYTVQEFAIKLNISDQTLRSWIKKGEIFAMKVGGDKKPHYRIHASEIDRLYVNRNTNKEVSNGLV